MASWPFILSVLRSSQFLHTLRQADHYEIHSAVVAARGALITFLPFFLIIMKCLAASECTGQKEMQMCLVPFVFESAG